MKINRLSDEKSPYLIRHADSPVDWHPWDAKTFEKAEAEDKPIFLCIGSSSCHWCHRMEREHFRNGETASLLHRQFIPILVDREERADVEKVYLAAVQFMTGRAGWPLSLFLMPDGRPFYGGTYFPPEPREGLPSFRQVLEQTADSYRNNRDRLNLSADVIMKQVRAACHPSPAPGPLEPALVEQGTAALVQRIDERYGGLIGVPKFPPAVVLSFLFRPLDRAGDPELLLRVQKTLDGMIRGGIYDQIGGGFHRCSTDARWLVPSFEKNLSDNALLIPVLIDAHLITGNPSYLRTAAETLDFLLTDLRSPGGGFHASLDSEAGDEEGGHYLWSKREVLEVMGGEEGELFCDLFGITETGNVRDGLNVLHRSTGMGGLARRAGLPLEEFMETFRGWQAALLERRRTRRRPRADEKIVTAWNGLAMSALARGAQVLEDARYLDAARDAANFALGELRAEDGRICRYHHRGQSRQAGFLDDYAALAAGLLDLYETDFEPRWLSESIEITDRMVDRFSDGEGGGFFFSTDGGPLPDIKEFDDSATPCGNALATMTLLRLGVLLDSRRYLERAFRSIEAARGLLHKVPTAHPGMLSALDFYLSPTREIAVAGRLEDARTEAFLAEIRKRYLPNRALALADPGRPHTFRIPLVEHKATVDGKPAVYLCRDYRCDNPITDPEELAKNLYVGQE